MILCVHLFYFVGLVKVELKRRASLKVNLKSLAEKDPQVLNANPNPPKKEGEIDEKGDHLLQAGRNDLLP